MSSLCCSKLSDEFYSFHQQNPTCLFSISIAFKFRTTIEQTQHQVRSTLILEVSIQLIIHNTCFLKRAEWKTLYIVLKTLLKGLILQTAKHHRKSQTEILKKKKRKITAEHRNVLCSPYRLFSTVSWNCTHQGYLLMSSLIVTQSLHA